MRKMKFILVPRETLEGFLRGVTPNAPNDLHIRGMGFDGANDLVVRFVVESVGFAEIPLHEAIPAFHAAPTPERKKK
jgi:hypothetical protein